MAILTRTKINPGQRWDLEDYNTLLSALRTDSKLWHQEFFSANNVVLRGFVVTGLGGLTASVTNAGATLLLPENSSDFSFFTAASGAAPTVVPASSLVSGVRNYLELSLSTETGTPISKAFWDSSLNSGSGAEFAQIVDTVTSVKVSVSIIQGGFSGSVDTTPLAILDVNGSGVITSIFDRRELLGRLAAPGDPTKEYVWASKIEAVYTLVMTGTTGTFVAGETINIGATDTAVVVAGGTSSITFNQPTGVNFFPVTSTVTGLTSGATGTIATISEAFTGADKDIGTLEDMIKALMTEVKNIKGTNFWYEDAAKNLGNVDGSLVVGVGGGTANAQTVTTTPPFVAFKNGMRFSYKPTVSNTSTTTFLTLDSLLAKQVRKIHAGTIGLIEQGDISLDVQADLVYLTQDDTYLLLNPANGLTRFGNRVFAGETVDITLVGVTGAIIVGSSDGTTPHIAIDGSRLQAKADATTIAPLILNPFGGSISIGSGGLGLGGQIFSSVSEAIHISTSVPEIRFEDTDQALNQKTFGITGNQGIRLVTYDDDGSNGTDRVVWDRLGIQTQGVVPADRLNGLIGHDHQFLRYYGSNSSSIVSISLGSLSVGDTIELKGYLGFNAATAPAWIAAHIEPGSGNVATLQQRVPGLTQLTPPATTDTAYNTTAVFEVIGAGITVIQQQMKQSGGGVVTIFANNISAFLYKA